MRLHQPWIALGVSRPWCGTSKEPKPQLASSPPWPDLLILGCQVPSCWGLRTWREPQSWDRTVCGLGQPMESWFHLIMRLIKPPFLKICLTELLWGIKRRKVYPSLSFGLEPSTNVSCYLFLYNLVFNVNVVSLVTLHMANVVINIYLLIWNKKGLMQYFLPF